jgi:hypothetical protein
MTDTAPKTFTVVKTLPTQTRRLPVGMTITEADLDGPVTLADWLRLGFLEEPAKAAPARAVRAAPILADPPADTAET